MRKPGRKFEKEFKVEAIKMVQAVGMAKSRSRQTLGKQRKIACQVEEGTRC